MLYFIAILDLRDYARECVVGVSETAIRCGRGSDPAALESELRWLGRRYI